MAGLQAEVYPTYHRCICVVRNSDAGNMHSSGPSSGPLKVCPCAVEEDLSFGNADHLVAAGSSNSAALRDVPQASAHLPQHFVSGTEEAAVEMLEEIRRAAQGASNAQCRLQLLANDEYRANENGFNRGTERYGTFEELGWLQECFSEEEWNSLKSLWPPETIRDRRNGKEVPASGNSSVIRHPDAPDAARSGPASLFTINDNILLVPLRCPPVPADEPRFWVLVSVPNSAVTPASTMTLADLLSSNANALCVLPDGHLAPANGAQLNSWLPLCRRHANEVRVYSTRAS